MRDNPKSAKKNSQAVSLLCAFGSVRLKGLSKMLLKSTPGEKEREPETIDQPVKEMKKTLFTNFDLNSTDFVFCIL
jgi:hypothetical protein